MQNEHKELYYLMDWVVPGCLGPKKAFMQYYAEPMKMGQRVGASKWELATVRSCVWVGHTALHVQCIR